MAILTTGYVDLTIGTSTRLALAPSTAAFDLYEEQAREAVRAKAQVAGYSIPTNSTNAKVRELVCGQWYVKAMGWRKGMDLPPNVSVAVLELEQVQSGKLPIPGLTPSAENGVGGVKFSATTGTGGRSQYFSRKQLSGNWGS